MSGLPGCGKTTVARLVARELSLEHVYAGDIFRRQAEAHGLSLGDYLRRAETDPSIQGFSEGVFWERNSLSVQKSHKARRSSEATLGLFDE